MDDQNPYSAPESRVSSRAEGEIQLATRWERLGGAIVDTILTLLITMPLLFFFTDYISKVMAQEEIPTSETIYINLFSTLLFFALNGYFLTCYGQTIGKRVVGTKIVSVVDHKILPFWKVVTLRYLPLTAIEIIPIPILPGILSIVNVLFIFREDKRCVHDHIAGTIVIKADE